MFCTVKCVAKGTVPKYSQEESSCVGLVSFVKDRKEYIESIKAVQRRCGLRYDTGCG